MPKGSRRSGCRRSARTVSQRDGSSVCELTSLVCLSSLPERTRLIVRREPLHPGAQRSLFPSLEYRYWGFYTDCEGDPAELDLVMRAHAHVENHIARLKDSGLCRFPFSSFAGECQLDGRRDARGGPRQVVPALVL